MDSIGETKEMSEFNEDRFKVEPEQTRKVRSEDFKNTENLEALLNKRDSFIQCDVHFYSKAHEICEIVIMGLMVLSGLFVMGYTFYTLIHNATSDTA